MIAESRVRQEKLEVDAKKLIKAEEERLRAKAEKLLEKSGFFLSERRSIGLSIVRTKAAVKDHWATLCALESDVPKAREARLELEKIEKEFRKDRAAICATATGFRKTLTFSRRIQDISDDELAAMRDFVEAVKPPCSA